MLPMVPPCLHVLDGLLLRLFIVLAFFNDLLGGCDRYWSSLKHNLKHFLLSVLVAEALLRFATVGYCLPACPFHVENHLVNPGVRLWCSLNLMLATSL